tara:strand:- start:33 stop:641 length:609 start_codon:yes stop_codon:yes gene_type:complete
MFYLKVKYSFDKFFAICGIILLSPLIIIIAILIKIKLGDPIFFIQERPGLKEKMFYLIKFRTMNNKKDIIGNLLQDDMRMTVFGKWLRETSIDEIPTLINIFKGEMSFVGPRPLLKEYLDFYSEIENKRHLLKPGLTGLAQINGRNKISWKKKFEYDILYINNVSFFLDLKIFLLTFIKVIRREGINPKNKQNVECFRGHNK